MPDSCPLVPCATCPWRRSSTIGGADIPGFDIELMRRLRNTVPRPGDARDAFRPIMACHGSTEGADSPCRGYLVRYGWTNLAVRVAAAQGRIPLPAIVDAGDGLDLWSTFDEMLDAYEEAQP